MDTGNCITERNVLARASSFLIGLLIGGMVGAMAMLLLAPRSGKATRARIQHRGLEFRDQMAEGVDNAEEQVRATVYRVSKDLRNQVEEVQHQGQALFDRK
jgi:gas vesicle protein